jgi:uncharacterized membrane protein YfcA
MPELATWQWVLGVISAVLIGLAKTGVPGVATLTVSLMVLTAGDARHGAAWAAPILITADVFAVAYWRRHAEARALFSLVPWVAAGMVAGAFALSLDERILRRMVGVIVLAMLAITALRRWYGTSHIAGRPWFYGISTGFATTVANAAGPIMGLYLLTKRLPKEQFVATGAWFFFIVNVSKLPIYAAHHLFSRASLTFDLLMIPPVVCGAFSGLWLVHRIPQRFFELLVIVLSAVSSLILFR